MGDKYLFKCNTCVIELKYVGHGKQNIMSFNLNHNANSQFINALKGITCTTLKFMCNYIIEVHIPLISVTVYIGQIITNIGIV